MAKTDEVDVPVDAVIQYEERFGCYHLLAVDESGAVLNTSTYDPSDFEGATEADAYAAAVAASAEFTNVRDDTKE